MGARARLAILAVAVVAGIAAIVWQSRRTSPDPRAAAPPRRVAPSPGPTPTGRIETPPAPPSARPPEDAHPQANVHGKVVGPSGAPAEADLFAARLGDQTGNGVAAHSGADGAFSLSLESGDWNLEGWNADAIGGTIVKVPAEGAVVADFTLQEGAIVHGRVLGPDDLPVPSAKIIDMGSMPRGTSGPDGTYRVVVLPFVAMLTAEAPGLVSIPSELKVRPGGDYELDLRLGRSCGIRGRVVDASGAPIAGAQVKDSGIEEGGGISSSNTPATATADADGAFDLEGLQAGKHFLTAEARGYQSEWGDAVTGAIDVKFTLTRGGRIEGKVVRKGTGEPVDRASVDYHPAAEPIQTPQHFVSGFTGADGTFTLDGLEPGRVVLKVDARGFSEVYSEPIDVTVETPIAGVVVEVSGGGTVRGTVVSAADGRPVRGAKVYRLQKYGGGDWEERGVAHQFGGVASDEEGRFEVGDLPPGAVRLRLRHADFSPLDRTVTVAEGQVVEERFVLGAGARIHGHVRGKDDKPLKDSEVGAGKKGWAESRQTFTEADGRYELDGLSPGPWVVVALQPADAVKDRFPIGSKEVNLEAGGDAEVDFPTAGGVRLRGTLRKGAQVLPGVEFVILSLHGAGVPLPATTDATGNYEMEGMIPGPYLVAVEGIQIRIEVPSGVAEVSKDLVLPTGGVSGTVLDAATRAPAAGASVMAMRRGLPTGGIAEVLDRAAGAAQAGADGRYAISGLGAGDYDLLVSVTGTMPQVAGEVSLKDEETVQGKDLVAEHGARLRVRAIGADGAPLAGATLTLRDAHTGASLNTEELVALRTDEKGETQIGPLAPGTYDVSAHAEGRASAHVRVEVGADRDAETQVALLAPGRLSVVVRDTSGAPVARAALVLWTSAGLAADRRLRLDEMTNPLNGESDQAGRIDRDDLAPGHYRGEVAAGDLHATIEVDVEAGRTVEAPVRLDRK